MDNASPSEPEARMRHYRIGTSSTGFVAADPAANALETASGLESRSLIALKSGCSSTLACSAVCVSR
jgi:hypothetical protein